MKRNFIAKFVLTLTLIVIFFWLASKAARAALRSQLQRALWKKPDGDRVPVRDYELKKAV